MKDDLTIWVPSPVAISGNQRLNHRSSVVTSGDQWWPMVINGDSGDQWDKEAMDGTSGNGWNKAAGMNWQSAAISANEVM